MQEEAARAGAALAGGANRAEQDAAQQQLRVGVRERDDAVVAAQLEQRAAEPLRDRAAHLTPHVARAGSRNQRRTPVVNQQFADFAA